MCCLIWLCIAIEIFCYWILVKGQLSLDAICYQIGFTIFKILVLSINSICMDGSVDTLSIYPTFMGDIWILDNYDVEILWVLSAIEFFNLCHTYICVCVCVWCWNTMTEHLCVYSFIEGSHSTTLHVVVMKWPLSNFAWISKLDLRGWTIDKVICLIWLLQLFKHLLLGLIFLVYVTKNVNTLLLENIKIDMCFFS